MPANKTIPVALSLDPDLDRTTVPGEYLSSPEGEKRRRDRAVERIPRDTSRKVFRRTLCRGRRYPQFWRLSTPMAGVSVYLHLTKKATRGIGNELRSFVPSQVMRTTPELAPSLNYKVTCMGGL
ncbi:hypothetical protein TNCV_3370491 [Trichonephila clavipes]|nr:hypothetical protein TNCV_3370491 [Trichonephila clavipes]